MAVNFPNNPVNGEQHVDPESGVVYVYDAASDTWTGTNVSPAGTADQVLMDPTSAGGNRPILIKTNATNASETGTPLYAAGVTIDASDNSASFGGGINVTGGDNNKTLSYSLENGLGIRYDDIVSVSGDTFGVKIEQSTDGNTNIPVATTFTQVGVSADFSLPDNKYNAITVDGDGVAGSSEYVAYKAINPGVSFGLSIGYQSTYTDTSTSFNFLASGASPNFFQGNTYIGGSYNALGSSTNINLNADGTAGFKGVTNHGGIVSGGTIAASPSGNDTFFADGDSSGDTHRSFHAQTRILDLSDDNRIFLSNVDFAGAGTINDVTHFQALPGSLPANLSITDHIGFEALSTIGNTGVVNAYGYVSRISTGEGEKRFNFYADSNAPNFFNGSTYIGGSPNFLGSTTNIDLKEDGSARFSGDVTAQNFIGNFEGTVTSALDSLKIYRRAITASSNAGYRVLLGENNDVGNDFSDTFVVTNAARLFYNPSTNTLAGLEQVNANSSSATKLQTSRTLWGRPFDGTANVAGSLVEVSSITGAGGANIKFSSTSAFGNYIEFKSTFNSSLNTNGLYRFWKNDLSNHTDIYFAGEENRAIVFPDQSGTVALIADIPSSLTLSGSNGVTVVSTSVGTDIRGVNATLNSVGVVELNDDTDSVSVTKASTANATRLAYNRAEEYAPSKTGLNATGTWDINIIGNSASASLATVATNANNIYRKSTLSSTNQSYRVLLGNPNNNYNSYSEAYVVSNASRLLYNPSTNTLSGLAQVDANATSSTTSGTATNATNVNVLEDLNSDEVNYINFCNGLSGNRRINTDRNLTYNPETNVIGSSISGNANTATTATKANQLTTSRTLWGQPFNGTTNVSQGLSGVTSISGEQSGQIVFSTSSNNRGSTLEFKSTFNTNAGAIGQYRFWKNNISYYTDMHFLGATNRDVFFQDKTGTVALLADLPEVINYTASNGITIIGSVITGINANTSTIGVVQLTDSTSSTSQTTAATPNSVRLTYNQIANYAPSKNGSGASGDWGINITGTSNNAKLLDNLDSLQFLRSDANDIVSAVTTWSRNGKDSIILRKPAVNNYAGVTFQDVNTERWSVFLANNSGNDLYVQKRVGDSGIVNSVLIDYTTSNITCAGEITAPKFIGDLDGTVENANNAVNATNATNVNILPDNATDTNRYVLFSGATSGNQRINSDNSLTYNPKTNVLNTDISGSADSANTAGSATTAGTASRIFCTAQNSDSTHYMTFVDSTSGDQELYVDNDLKYNPNTNILSSGNGFDGDIFGLLVGSEFESSIAFGRDPNGTLMVLDSNYGTKNRGKYRFRKGDRENAADGTAFCDIEFDTALNQDYYENQAVSFPNKTGRVVITTDAAGVLDASEVSYKYNDSNAVERTVESRLDDYISILDFGAYNDATNATATTNAVKNAFAVAAQYGKRIYFPSGRYVIEETIETDKSVHMFGDGDTSEIIFQPIGGFSKYNNLYTTDYPDLFKFSYNSGTSSSSVYSISMMRIRTSSGYICGTAITLTYTGNPSVIGAYEKMHLNNVVIHGQATASGYLDGYWRKGLYLSSSAGVYGVGLRIANQTGHAERRKFQDAVTASTSNISSLSGEKTIAGVTTNDSIVLLTNQNNEADNGLWKTSSGNWGRALGADNSDLYIPGRKCLVTGGNNAGTWYYTGIYNPTLGSTDLTFSQTNPTPDSDTIGVHIVSETPPTQKSDGYWQHHNQINTFASQNYYLQRFTYCLKAEKTLYPNTPPSDGKIGRGGIESIYMNLGENLGQNGFEFWDVSATTVGMSHFDIVERGITYNGGTTHRLVNNDIRCNRSNRPQEFNYLIEFHYYIDRDCYYITIVGNLIFALRAYYGAILCDGVQRCNISDNNIGGSVFENEPGPVGYALVVKRSSSQDIVFSDNTLFHGYEERYQRIPFLITDGADPDNVIIEADWNISDGESAILEREYNLVLKGGDNKFTLGVNNTSGDVSLISENTDNISFRQGNSVRWFINSIGDWRTFQTEDQRITLTQSGNIHVGHDGNTVPGAGNTDSGISLFSSGLLAVQSASTSTTSNTLILGGKVEGQTLQTFNKNGDIKGRMVLEGAGVTFYGQNSDHRLKTNVATLSSTTSNIQSLRPVEYQLSDQSDTVVRRGFIAHELASVYPDAVLGDKDAVDSNSDPVYQMIDTTKIIPDLVKSLQEALTRIDTLETTVNNLNTVLELDQ